jgi:hypothetical protein
MNETFLLGHWTDDYEDLQRLLLDTPYPGGVELNPNIYDQTFSGLGGGMYREWVALEDEEQTRPARLENWDPEDLAAYVGGPYVKG